MYAQLGDITFDGLFGYHEYEDTGETKYAEVDLIGGKPDLQHTGEELDTITISIRLHESFCDPAIRYGQFNSHRLSGDILPFVDGYGNVIGNFVIEKIKRTVNSTDTSGRVTLCECDVTLKEYVDPNRAVTVSTQAKDNAFAITATALSLNILSPAPNPPADVFASMADISQASGLAVAGVAKASADSANAASYFKNALVSANAAYNSADALITKITDYISQGAGTYTGMVAVLTAVKANATSLISDIGSGDIAAASASASVLGSSVFQLNDTALPVQELLILR